MYMKNICGALGQNISIARKTTQCKTIFIFPKILDLVKMCLLWEYSDTRPLIISSKMIKDRSHV